MLKFTVTLFILVFAMNASAADWDSEYKGSKPDWLALELNAEHRERCEMPNSEAWCIGVAFMAFPPNKIQVLLNTRGSVPLSEYEADVELYKQIIKMTAEVYSKTPVKVEFKKSDQGK